MRDRPKLFISHASEDKAFVREMIANLELGGLDYWFDAVEIRNGDSIPEKINSGLIDSSHAVLVLSKHYLGDEKYWTWRELWAWIAKESHSKRGKLLIPIRHALEYSDFAEQVPIIADRFTLDFVGNPKGAADEILNAINPSKTEFRTVSGELSPTEGLPSRHNVPFPRPTKINCVGREIFIERLMGYLAAKRGADFSEIESLVISAIPGSGKSTVATELAYRVGRSFIGGAYWLDCSSEHTLVASAKQITRLQGKPECAEANIERKVLFTQVREFCEAQPCLIIFDALDPDEVASNWHELMPRTGHSRVLITTRTEKFDTLFRSQLVILPELDIVDSTSILSQFGQTHQAPHTEIEAAELINFLGNLPSILQIAARYVHRHALTYKQYLEILKKTSGDWTALRSTSPFLKSHDSVLQLCFADLSQQGQVGELAKAILKLCVLIATAGGSLKRWNEDGDDPCCIAASLGVSRENLHDTELFEHAILLAERVGLLRLLESGETSDVWMHSLTHRYITAHLEEPDARALVHWISGDWLKNRHALNFAWIRLDERVRGYLDSVALLANLAPEAQLDVIDILLEMQDFTNEIDGKMLTNRALSVISNSERIDRKQEAIFHFKLLQAYSDYRKKDLDGAEKVYESVWIELLAGTASIDTRDLIDFCFYYSCLLIELGGEFRIDKAKKICRGGLLTLLGGQYDEILERSGNASAYKLRVVRLLNVVTESFPELLEAQHIALHTELKAEIEQRLGQEHYSLNRQFLRARGPLYPALMFIPSFG